MVNRIVLNETSYHGAGAIQEIATEATKRGFKKAFVCSDPVFVKMLECFLWSFGGLVPKRNP